MRVERLRGNINTRLRKLGGGEFDAIIAAASGPHRVGQANRITETLTLDVMHPLVGAGIIVLQCRSDVADFSTSAPGSTTR